MTGVSKYERELTKVMLRCRERNEHYDSLVWCEQCQTWHVYTHGKRMLCTVSPDCTVEATSEKEVSHE